MSKFWMGAVLVSLAGLVGCASDAGAALENLTSQAREGGATAAEEETEDEDALEDGEDDEDEDHEDEWDEDAEEDEGFDHEDACWELVDLCLDLGVSEAVCDEALDQCLDAAPCEDEGEETEPEYAP